MNLIALALTLNELNSTRLSVMGFSHYSHGVAEIDADNSKVSEPTNTLVLNGGNATAMNVTETIYGRAHADNYTNYMN
jgi:hypothetical protein